MNTGQRLRALRESLDPTGARAPVGRRTLDYCYPNGTNRWGHMEDTYVDPSANLALVRDTVRAVVDRLDVTEGQRVDAVRFVMGEVDALPWVQARWLPGKTPVRPFGGSRGAKSRRKPAGEVIALPPLSYEVQALALLRANREGELDDVETVASIYTLGRSYYNKTERSGDAVA